MSHHQHRAKPAKKQKRVDLAVENKTGRVVGLNVQQQQTGSEVNRRANNNSADLQSCLLMKEPFDSKVIKIQTATPLVKQKREEESIHTSPKRITVLTGVS